LRDILQVIARTTGDAGDALGAIAAAAGRLCDADFARVWLREHGELVAVPGWSVTALPDFRAAQERLPGTGSGPVGRAWLTGQTVHTPDLLADAEANAPPER